MKLPEVIAGELCRDMHSSFAGSDWTAELPRHIRIMLGKNEWQQPLWQDRAMPPNGQRFVLQRFEDYLMRPFREGLGFGSWWTIHAALETQGREGIEVINMIRGEVPAYDLKVRRDRLRTTGESWDEARKERHAGPGRGHKTVDDIHRLPKGTSAARIVARLKRDAPKIAERLEAGEFESARAAARAAGFKVDTPLLTIVRRAWKRMSPEDRATFRAEIEEN